MRKDNSLHKLENTYRIFTIQHTDMTDPLSKLFGSTARLKLLRLFLFNTRQSFTLSDIISRTRISSNEARKETSTLISIGMINRITRGQTIRYSLEHSFTYTSALQNLLLNAPTRGDEIVAAIKKTGVMKLVVLSGLFTTSAGDGLDIIVVGEKIQDRKLRDQIKRFEAEIGKELKFAVLTSDDFLYRINMNDKLIRDVFDFPHRILIDKLNIGLK